MPTPYITYRGTASCNRFQVQVFVYELATNTAAAGSEVRDKRRCGKRSSEM